MRNFDLLIVFNPLTDRTGFRHLSHMTCSTSIGKSLPECQTAF
jgi:hypothetical protein